MPNSTALKKEGVVSNVFSRGTWEICAVQAAVAPFGMLCPGRTFRAILSGLFFFIHWCTPSLSVQAATIPSGAIASASKRTQPVTSYVMSVDACEQLSTLEPVQ